MTGDELIGVLFPIMMIIFVLSVIGLVTMIIYLQRKYLKELQNQNKKENDVMLERLNQMNSQILKDLKSYTQGSSNGYHLDHNLFDTFVKLRNSIKENCTATMNKTDACRLAVYLFHNGNSSTHGIKFFKMSCICEKVAIGSGIREQSIDHSNIPINLFDDMIDMLIENGRYIIMNDDEVAATNRRIFISSPKIKYSQAVSIFDENNNILGFVLLEMDHSYDRQEALGEKEYIDVLVNQLIPILSYAEYVNAAI